MGGEKRKVSMLMAFVSKIPTECLADETVTRFHLLCKTLQLRIRL